MTHRIATYTQGLDDYDAFAETTMSAEAVQ